MSWPVPNQVPAPWNPAGMVMQDMNSASYTPEQWALMQQQNWQQWSQWQQQYSQWQNQYGDKFSQHLQLQSFGGIPLPPPSGAVPPPPPDKPPPPPPHENNQPLFNTNQDKPSPSHNPQQRNSSNFNTNTGTGNNQWSYSSDKQPPAVNSEDLKKLVEEERLFDIQFQKWEEEIDKWRQENVNHPDKQAYKDYEAKFEACRTQLLERRQQMKMKRANLLNNPAQANNTGNTTIAPPPPKTSNQNNYSQNSQSQNSQNNSYQRQYDASLSANKRQHNNNNNKNVEPQDRYESYHQDNDDNHFSSHGNQAIPNTNNKPDNSSFLPASASSKGIPGLDLVPDSHANKKQDVIDLSDDKQEGQGKTPDYSTISMGINSILGDEKIMNILSMVRGLKPGQIAEDNSNAPNIYNNNPPGQSNNQGNNRNQNFNQQQRQGNVPPPNRQGGFSQHNQDNSQNQGGYNRQNMVQQDQHLNQNQFGGQNTSSGPVGPRGPGGPSGPRGNGPNGPYGPGIQQGGPGIRHSGPNMRQSGPGMQLGGPNMQQGGPNMQRGGNMQQFRPGMQQSGVGMRPGGPVMRPSMPGTTQSGPGMRQSGPGMQQSGHNMMRSGGPNMRPTGSTVQQGRPGMQQGGPGMQQGGPSMQQGGPGMQQGGPSMQQGGPGIQQGGPGMQQGGPSMQQGGPSMQQGGPGMQQGGPGIQQGGPGMQQGPNMRPGGPNVYHGQPNMQQPPPLMANRISMPIQPNNAPERSPLQDVSSQQNADFYGAQRPMPAQQQPKPKWVEDPLFTPSIVVEYEHKSLRLKARDFIEPVHTFDYNHVSKDDEFKKKDYEYEADELFTRKPRRSERDFAEDRFRDQGNRDLYQRDYERRGMRDDFRDMPKDIREIRGEVREPREQRDIRYDDMRDSREMPRDIRGEPRDRIETRDVRDRMRDDMSSRERPREEFDRRKEERHEERRRDDRDRYGNKRVVGDYRDRDRDRRDIRRDDRRDDSRIRSTSRDKDSRKRGISRESDLSDISKKSKDAVDIPRNKPIVMIDDLLEPPGRSMRPEKIVIILRGLPGSGKSYLAKLIRDREAEHGGTARIMSIDDYFMQEGEIEETDPTTGKTFKKPTMKYEYDEGMEEIYINSLKRAFKRSITDGYFSFLIYDAVNCSLQNYADIWNFSRQNGFQVYICSMENDVQTAYKRNIHNRKLEDIEVMASRFFSTPAHHIQLDATTLLQSAAITDVQMEDVNEVMDDVQAEEEVESVFTSKWEKMDDAVKLARLDGTSKPLRPSQLSMEEYLQLDDWTPNVAKPGKKTVRWADIEERRQQEKMRAIGFVVGQTDWNRMTDPTMGSSALTQTKYIERNNKRN